MTIALLIGIGTAAIDARQGMSPHSWTKKVSTLAEIPVLVLPAVDVAAEIAADESHVDRPGPLRYAVPIDVALTPSEMGHWETLPSGERLWRARVYAPGATDLNFGFDEYWLPAGATLHVYGEGSGDYEGPYTERDHEKHGQLWMPPVIGDRAVVELWLPAGVAEGPRLKLTRVGAGYRNFFEPGSLTKHGSCNVDVICPLGDSWRDQIRSVGLYSLNGSMLCTGTMVIDVPRSFRPFFLTANHCGIDAGNAPSMVVFWNFESPACGLLSGGSLADSQSGASLRAARADADVTLVELDDMPDFSFDVTWSGWDRSFKVPTGAVGIHHPDNDEKSISLDEDPPTTIDSCIGSGGVNSHWRVGNWEEGTTEPDSSGSGLWSADNGLLIGVLSGGTASCSNPSGFACYGKLAKAWIPAPNPSVVSGPRDLAKSLDGLREWLDPDNELKLRAEGGSPEPVRYVAHQGEDSCQDSANQNGIWEPGEMIEVPITLRSATALTGVSGRLTSCTRGVRVADVSVTWPDLNPGDDFEATSPFSVRLARDLPCSSRIRFDLEITAAEGGPFHLTFEQQVGSAVASLPQPIPDLGTVASLFAAGPDVPLTDVDVAVEIAHSWVGDLSVRLTNPAGTAVQLLDRPGVPADQAGCGDSNLDLIFDDDAAISGLEDHCAGSDPWFAGTATPVGSLADFNGASGAGTWSLEVTDGAKGDVGALVDWQLLTEPPLSGSCRVCNQLFEGDPSWGVVAGGGDTSTGGGFALGGTAGQAVTGVSQNGKYAVIGGFWAGPEAHEVLVFRDDFETGNVSRWGCFSHRSL